MSPAPPPASRRSSRTVAAEPRKRRFARLLLLVTLLVAALLLLSWLRFGGQGGGFLGGGSADGEGTASDAPADRATPQPLVGGAGCVLHLDRDGLRRGEAPVPLAEAIADCRAGKIVTISVAGDAPYGQFEVVRAAFEQAGLTVKTP
jgi:hypothetical protein